MLLLSRKIEEGIRIGDTIEIKVLDVFITDEKAGKKGKVASIGIEAPRDITILRKELVDIRQENEAAQLSAMEISADKAHDLAVMLRNRRGKETQG